MIKIVLSVLALVLCASSAEAKTKCLTGPRDDGYYAYRVVDNKKCWYKGRKVLAKSSLNWPKERPKPKPIIVPPPADVVQIDLDVLPQMIPLMLASLLVVPDVMPLHLDEVVRGDFPRECCVPFPRVTHTSKRVSLPVITAALGTGVGLPLLLAVGFYYRERGRRKVPRDWIPIVV
jgi:hypothetical protein